ncbi:MAG TPA: winged helix-turn-helix domain-containing protein [Nitrososphaeraceae archaeon]|jgi:predicted transcriptional regulator|nr:winged helix-turn-helix domain-containing protein [Nitrososphaeraceae archaeon]
MVVVRFVRYRNRTEILSQILETANGGGATKTKIMYKAYLRYDKLQEYLTVLTESDLLHYDNESHTFKTTEHGLSFIEAYNQIDKLMNS